MTNQRLPDQGLPKREATLEVFHGSRCIFRSDGNWLHPLFELEEFLDDRDYPPESLLLRDKIIGKAAAVLLIRMGIRKVEIGLLSRLGEELLRKYSVCYAYERIVDQILCQTEHILEKEDDLEAAYRVLFERRKGRLHDAER